MHGRMDGRWVRDGRDACSCANDAARAYPAPSLRSCAPLSPCERGRSSLRSYRYGRHTSSPFAKRRGTRSVANAGGCAACFCPFRCAKGARAKRAGYGRCGWTGGACETARRAFVRYDAARAYPAHSLRSCAPLSPCERGRSSLRSCRRGRRTSSPFAKRRGTRSVANAGGCTSTLAPFAVRKGRERSERGMDGADGRVVQARRRDGCACACVGECFCGC